MSLEHVDALLIIPPVLYARQPSIGSAYLCSCLKKNGFAARIWDLNAELSLRNDGDDYYWSQYENNIKFIDDNRNLLDHWVEKIIDSHARVIGFTVWTTTLQCSLALARMVKEKDHNRTIVFGGYLCNIKAEELIAHPEVDFVVRGEGEETLLHIMRSVSQGKSIDYCPGALMKKNGEIVDGGQRPEMRDLNGIPFPDFSDYALDKYLFKNHLPIIFSRGCSWNCAFCTVFRCWKKFRSRSAENIYEEITTRVVQYPMLKQFELCDCAYNQDAGLLSQLCDMIIGDGLHLRFSGLAQIRPEMDRHLLSKMRKAGFILCNFGVESGSLSVLKAMGKRYTADEAERVIKDTHEAGIDVILNFVVGFPGETEDNFQETLRFIERVKNHVTNIAPGHECDIEHTSIQTHADKYGIAYAPEKIHYWSTANNMINAEERKRRAEIFDRFVREMQIKMKCGFNDRSEIEKYERAMNNNTDKTDQVSIT
jgi:tRNA A37 methylthiotransferase MiaB